MPCERSLRTLGWETKRGPTARQLAFLVIACASGCVLAGCAVPGEPTARHPLVPRPVVDLAARQQGDSVVLSFTLPRDSTDEKALPEAPTVEVYRDINPPAPAPPNQIGVRPVRRLPGQLADTIPGSLISRYEKDGHVEIPDSIDPAESARQPGKQLYYTVRTRASRVADSANSNTVTQRIYPAPEPVRDLHVTVTEQAVVVAWAPSEHTTTGAPLGSSPVYRVYRAEVETETSSEVVRDLSEAKLRTPLALIGEVSGAEYRDANFEWGHAYYYTVRAATRFGADIVEAADPKPVVVLAKDVFPPAAPQGLEAVVIPATPEAPAYVELAWGISPEADLAGYIVYRSDQPDTQGTRLNSDPLPAPTLRDISVEPGRRYFYRSTAVDRSGNESTASAVVMAEVPGR
jgi:hypothetical protein